MSMRLKEVPFTARVRQGSLQNKSRLRGVVAMGKISLCACAFAATMLQGSAAVISLGGCYVEIDNYTFQSGNTYVIEGVPVLVDPVFEEGTVIKFKRGAQLRISNSITTPTSSGACKIILT